jgi:hypothetical protein
MTIFQVVVPSSQNFTEILEVLAASIIKVMSD